MKDCRQFYIDGAWVHPAGVDESPVINPATEERIATISLGSAADVDRAVAAARRAFEPYSETSPDSRLALLQRIIEVYQSRVEDLAETISREMGAPIWLSRAAQAPVGLRHLSEMVKVLGSFKFEELKGSTLLRKEPIGVCGLITPWNWPMNQIVCKVAPALAAGCTMVLKPSEIAPLSAYLFTEILHEAAVPAGVFNMVNGDGPTVGAAISSHPGVAMVSFTGSARAGVAVASAAAPTVKRVTQELGGKSAYIILDDADLEKAVKEGARGCFLNTGQSCDAPTRMIKKGIEEGAELVAGGLGRPEGISKGYFVKPTVFAGVRSDMTIAREEIFGPVLSIIPYEDEDDAVYIANDTSYGLSGYVTSGNTERARSVAKRIRSGNVHVNGAQSDFSGCFGGYKQSGNGREWGETGLLEFLELKAIFGYAAS